MNIVIMFIFHNVPHLCRSGQYPAPGLQIPENPSSLPMFTRLWRASPANIIPEYDEPQRPRSDDFKIDSDHPAEANFKNTPSGSQISYAQNPYISTCLQKNTFLTHDLHRVFEFRLSEAGWVLLPNENINSWLFQYV